MSAIKTATAINPNAVNLTNLTTIGDLHKINTTIERGTGTSKAPTVNLFDTSKYQTKSPVKLGDGSSLALPSLNDEEVAKARELFGNIADEHKEELNQVGANLGQSLMAFIAQPTTATAGISGSPAIGATSAAGGHAKLGSAVGAPNISVSQASPDVAGATAQAASSYQKATGADYDTSVVGAAYMGVMGLQNQLTAYAKGMQATTNQQNRFRADASELGDALASWPEGASTQNFTWHTIDKDGNEQSHTEDLTKAQAQNALNDINGSISTLGSDTQLQQIQLQTMTQNYSNGINTMSNVLKVAYDTTKNTLGNIHY